MMRHLFNHTLIAHRGASFYAPENTQAAILRASELGSSFIEIDVQLARCGTPIIFHDRTLSRTTNGSGFLSRYSFKDLSQLDYGSWFSSEFKAEKILSLTQALEFIFSLNLNVNLELKPRIGEEKTLVNAVLSIVREKYEAYLCKILFSSFSFRALCLLRQAASDIEIGLLKEQKYFKPHYTSWLRQLKELAGLSLHINREGIHLNLIQTLKKEDYLIFVYTVNQAKEVLQLFEWGVDAVFTDNPLLLNADLHNNTHRLDC